MLFVGVFNTLKSDTFVFCRFDQVLRKFDPLVRDLVNEEMEKCVLSELTS